MNFCLLRIGLSVSAIFLSASAFSFENVKARIVETGPSGHDEYWNFNLGANDHHRWENWEFILEHETSSDNILQSNIIEKGATGHFRLDSRIKTDSSLLLFSRRLDEMAIETSLNARAAKNRNTYVCTHEESGKHVELVRGSSSEIESELINLNVSYLDRNFIEIKAGWLVRNDILIRTRADGTFIRVRLETAMGSSSDILGSVTIACLGS